MLAGGSVQWEREVCGCYSIVHSVAATAVLFGLRCIWHVSGGTVVCECVVYRSGADEREAARGQRVAHVEAGHASGCFPRQRLNRQQHTHTHTHSAHSIHSCCTTLRTLSTRVQCNAQAAGAVKQLSWTRFAPLLAFEPALQCCGVPPSTLCTRCDSHTSSRCTLHITIPLLSPITFTQSAPLPSCWCTHLR